MKDESSGVNWTYGGGEEEWDAFDRRMVRYMREKLNVFGERLRKRRYLKNCQARICKLCYDDLRVS